MESLVRKRFRSELRKIDWNFEDCSHNGEFAAVHWYPARFIPEIPGTLIGYFSEEGETVLDPFCGSGTTLTEAMRLRRKSIGIDLNPVAAMISAARTVTVSKRELCKQRDTLLDLIASVGGHGSTGDRPFMPLFGTQTPDPAELGKWFHPETLRELRDILEAIRHWDETASFRTVAAACFSAALRRSCSQEEHWGYVCDNMKPKKLINHDARQIFIEKLNSFVDLRNRFIDLCSDDWIRKAANRPNVMNAAAQQAMAGLAAGSVDLIVTSPPYLSVTDYCNSQRLTYLWWPEADRDGHRRVETGARWKRSRPTSLQEYLSDMTDCLANMARVLKGGRHAVIVVGESRSHPDYIDALVSIAGDAGLRLVDILDRRISRLRTLAPSLGDERIVLCQKT